MELTVKQLAQRIGADLVASSEQADRKIKAVAAVEAAGEGDITFITGRRYISALAMSGAGAVMVSEQFEGLDKPQLVVKNVNAALIEVLNAFAPRLKPLVEGVAPTATMGENVKIGKGVAIGPYVVIADNVEIGAGTVVGGGCKIGENSKIGGNCRLDSNVVVYHNCRLGSNVIIQANTTIGSTGFGYSLIDGSHRLVPHNGGVVIEDFVEIGANCCVDRAKFGNTIVGAGTKIDNLVQIAHNVVVGRCCLIAALVGISGSCKLGDGVVLAGQVGLADNIEIGAGAMVGAKSGVLRNVPAGRQMAWTPAIDRKDAMKVIGSVIRLPRMAEQLRQLTLKVEKLEAAEDHKE